MEIRILHLSLSDYGTKYSYLNVLYIQFQTKKHSSYYSILATTGQGRTADKGAGTNK